VNLNLHRWGVVGDRLWVKWQLVSDIIAVASPLIRDFLNLQPEERRQRIDGLQQILDALVPQLEVAVFEVLVGWLADRAKHVAGNCRICSARTRRAARQVKVKLKRFSTTVDVVRFRCRSCKTSRSPVREWLGLQSGMTSAGLDRAVTALSTEMSFGRAAKQMEEQHGHVVDRTLIERRTYAVGKEAMEFLKERRQARRDEVMDAGVDGGEVDCVERSDDVTPITDHMNEARFGHPCENATDCPNVVRRLVNPPRLAFLLEKPGIEPLDKVDEMF